MKSEEMKTIVLKYIRRHNGVSYAELERVFEQHGFSYSGSLEAYSDSSPHVVFWSGWNKQTFEIISELLREKRIERTPCTVLVYLIDGKGMTYPVLSDVSDLRSVHWLPCVFDAI